MQTCIKLLPGILRSKHLPWRIKEEAFFHLTNTLVYPLMVLLTLLMYPTFFNYFAPFKARTWGHYLFSASLFILATCSASTFFVFGQRELFGREAGWRSLVYLPLLMGLGVGISLNNTKAVFEAIWSAIKRRPSEFVRTPKYGVTNSASATGFRGAQVFTLHRLALPIIEIAFGLYMATCIWISLWYGFGRGSVPFLVIFAGGYFYVGFSSLYVLWRMQQEAEEELADAEPEAVSM